MPITWVVIVLGGLLAAGVVMTRRGPGGVVHIHNGAMTPLVGVRMNSGSWSRDVPPIEAGGTFDAEVPRGEGPTWEVRAPGCSGTTGWGLFRPFGGEVHVLIEASSIMVGDEETIDVLRTQLREAIRNAKQGGALQGPLVDPPTPPRAPVVAGPGTARGPGANAGVEAALVGTAEERVRAVTALLGKSPEAVRAWLFEFPEGPHRAPLLATLAEEGMDLPAALCDPLLEIAGRTEDAYAVPALVALGNIAEPSPAVARKLSGMHEPPARGERGKARDLANRRAMARNERRTEELVAVACAAAGAERTTALRELMRLDRLTAAQAERLKTLREATEGQDRRMLDHLLRDAK